VIGDHGDEARSYYASVLCYSRATHLARINNQSHILPTSTSKIDRCFSRLSAITIPILQTHSNIIVVLRWCLRSRQLQALLRREEDRSLIRLTHSYSAQLIGEFSFLLLPARKTTVPKTVLSRRSMTSVVTLLSLL
jgi:hypothetical protein